VTRYVAERLSGAKIAIIGGGAIGAALAYRLAQAGASVTLVERAYPGSGTTGRSFAWINGFRKFPREYHQLNARGIREHTSLRDELGGDWLHTDGGLFWITDDDADAVAALHQSVRQMRDWGYRVDRVAPDVVVHELEPDLTIGAEQVSEIYVCPNEGWIETVRMAQALIRAAMERYGARVVRSSVASLPRSGAGVGGVGLADGTEIAADVVVNASGPEAASVAALAGVALPVRRQPGVLFVTEPAPVSLRHVVRSPGCNLRPDGGGRVMIQREAFDTRLTDPPDRLVAEALASEALDHASRLAKGLAGIRVEAVRVGVRPMPRDGHPIVGFEPRVPGLYEILTHSGITLCAVLARLVTEELCGGSVPELEPYRPERFVVG